MIESVIGNLSLSNTGFVLLLKPREAPAGRVLPILIGVAEAQSIALAMARKELPRPMTHDLIKRLLDTFDAALTRVQITRFAGKTFYALLHLTRQGEAIPPVDARPSDAIALALRVGSPIFIEEKVIEKSRNIDFEVNLLEKDKLTDEKLKEFLENLPNENFGKYKM